jgi:hypothetical protein
MALSVWRRHLAMEKDDFGQREASLKKNKI